MFETSSDVLNMSLAIGFAVLVIFLSILIFYAIVTLRDVTKVVAEVREVVDKIHHSIVEPLKAIDFIIDKVKPYVSMVLERKMKEKKGKK